MPPATTSRSTGFVKIAARRAAARSDSCNITRYNTSLLNLRKYHPADYKRLLEIDQACFIEGIAYTEEEMRYFLAMPTAIVLVGLQNDTVQGFIIADRFRPRRASQSMGRIITID